MACLEIDKYYFGHFVPVVFEKYEIESLPLFGKLLDISFTMDDTIWTSRIINAISDMIHKSRENLDRVVTLLKSKINNDRIWLNSTIVQLKYNYYEAVDDHMSIEKAAQKVHKIYQREC